MILKNATLLHLWPPKVEKADVRIWDGRIARVAEGMEPEPGEEVELVSDRLLMPGLVNGHTHLYSALACGMPPPRRTPHTFQEILQEVWWRMDRVLDAGIVHACGLAGALDAIRCGTTGIIDHHASPKAIDGSLGVLSEAVGLVGQRGCYCYEATDRHGEEAGLRGVAESHRFAAMPRHTHDDRPESTSGLIGLHACMTCGPETMRAARLAASETGVSLHIHVAEDRCDRDVTNARFRRHLTEYLVGEGIAQSGTIIAHAIHLRAEEMATLAEAGCFFAHQSRSNQNNAVGHANLAAIPADRLLLGTDGLGADMFAEAQAAYFRSREAGTGLTPERVLQALANNARYLGQTLGEPKLGTLEPGAPADFISLDYRPATPITAGSLPWHFLFQMGSRHVESAWVGGRRVMSGRRALHELEHPFCELELQSEAQRLFAAMRAMP